MDRSPDSQVAPQQATGPVVYRVLVAVGIAVLAVALLGLVSYAIHIFLTAFAALLFGIALSTPAVWIAHSSRLSYGWSLGIVVFALAALVVVLASVIGLTLWEQVRQLGQALPTSVVETRARLESTAWGRWLLDNAAEPETDQQENDEAGQNPPDENQRDASGRNSNRGKQTQNDAKQEESGLAFGSPAFGTMLTGVGGAAYQVMHFVAALVVILFAGFYFASEAEWYRSGLVRLVPPVKRQRGEQILDELHHTLRWWIVGQLASMTIVGLVWGTGLWLLGVKLALALGLLAFVAELVPFLGPLVAAIPAFLMAATQSEVNLLYVFLLYVAVQTAESYVVQPLVQKRAIRLPPALTILAVMLLSYLGGLLGALLAAPLTVTAIVLVRKLYVEDALGDRG